MAERARELADRFAHASAEFRAFVEGIPEEYWARSVSAGDPRSIGIVVRHVAWAYAFESSYFQAMAAGHPLPPMSGFDAVNADLAAHWHNLSKDEILSALRTTSSEAIEWIRSLSEQQLGQTGQYWVGSPVWTVDQWVERVLIGHIGGHLKDIHATVEVDRRHRLA